MLTVRQVIGALASLALVAAPLMGQSRSDRRYSAPATSRATQFEPPGAMDLQAIRIAQTSAADDGEVTASNAHTAEYNQPLHSAPRPLATGPAASVPRPLNPHGSWKNVVTTFEPQLMPASYFRDHALGYGPDVSGAAAQYEPVPAQIGDGSDAIDYAAPPGEPSNGDLWGYYDQCGDRWWARADYLHWRIRGYRVPALVSSSSAVTPLATAGVLPDAEILFGDTRLDGDYRDGGRARIGWWTVDGQFEGYQVEYFGFDTENTRFSASANAGGDILARPFFNLDPLVNAEDASLLSGTGVTLVPGSGVTFDIDGTIDIDTRSELHSAALTRRHVWWVDFERNARLDYLIGYRYLRLDESLSISDVVTLNNPQGGGGLPAGTRIQRIDRFHTENDIHAGEVGLLLESHHGRWSLDLLSKLALGYSRQIVDIDGSTATQIGGVGPFVPAVGNPPPGGLLAQPDRVDLAGQELNIGERSRDVFVLMPEFELDLSYQLTSVWQATIGYNLIYANRVVRPGDQIDRRINPTYIPPNNAPAGEAAPARRFEQSYLWLHGLTAGVEARW